MALKTPPYYSSVYGNSHFPKTSRGNVKVALFNNIYAHKSYCPSVVFGKYLKNGKHPSETGLTIE
jgi:hypothetical protein